jgi:hypothetical protein
MDLGISDSCAMSVMILESIFIRQWEVCNKYVIDMTMFSNSVQSCEYVSIAVFLCAFQQLISVLLNVI